MMIFERHILSVSYIDHVKIKRKSLHESLFALLIGLQIIVKLPYFENLGTFLFYFFLDFSVFHVVRVISETGLKLGNNAMNMIYHQD
ncbi:hypothetical protein L2E82_25178 [Cichorium intybus]|uniref:Uncharacterized protein n=1 Tax=Cichorium intybus TaxID=13427 RepID=A0ACB9E3B1_CICIN|nr:hypothetical protein L2E82_25178 [Cichorium intybus]